jgi:hypothetical protein
VTISTNAYSINLIFDQLSLAKDARLYISSIDGAMVYDPVTAKQNISRGQSFLTDLVIGDEIILQ